MGWGFSASSMPEHAATTRAVCEVQQTISGESARKADIAPRHLNYCKAGRRAMEKVCFRPEAVAPVGSYIQSTYEYTNLGNRNLARA